jgi:hypothetical protein
MNTATAVAIASLAALTPTITCLIGIILQRQDTRDLRSEMIALRNVVQADMLLLHDRVAKMEGKRTN